MARIRSLKPAFFVDEDLAVFPFWIRILFEGLWCEADKEGRLEDRPLRLKASIFPYDKVDIESGLVALSKPKVHSPRHEPFLVRYAVDGNKYIQIINFHKHQSPHHTEKDSEIPAFTGEIPVSCTLDGGGGGTPHYPYIRNPKSINTKSKSAKAVGDAGIVVAAVIAHLNEKTGKSFRSGGKEVSAMIGARIAEGYLLEDFKRVIDVKVAKWRGDPKMDEFLRPSTLFCLKHFEEYLNEALPGRPARLGENKKPESAETKASRASRNAYESKLWAEKAGEIERIRTTVPPSKQRDAMDQLELEVRNQVATWVNSWMIEDRLREGAEGGWA